MSSGEPGLVGASLFGKDTWYRTPSQVHTTKSEFNIANVNALPRVDIIYAHANMSPDIISSAVANGAKGLVIAGVGDGNMTAPAVEAVKDAIAKGVVVVRSSRTNGGIIRRNIELDDDKLGTVASMQLNPAKARVLLQLALLKTKDTKKIQDYFNRY
jgi:L-asparaginase